MMTSRTLTRRESVFLSVTVFLVFVLAGFYGIWKPVTGRLSSLDAQIRVQKHKIVKRERLIAKTAMMQERYAEVFQPFHQTQSNEHVMSSTLSEIEELAGELQLQIFDQKPKRVQSTEYFNQFSVSLTINSSFTSMVEFLHAVQSAPFHFAVEEIRFDRGNRKDAQFIKTNLVLSKTLLLLK